MIFLKRTRTIAKTYLKCIIYVIFLKRQVINEAIVSNLGKRFTTIECEDGEYKLTHPVKGSILISLSSYSLNVFCDGSRMLDLDLFVALSGSGDRFFAVMDGHGEWGWLKPIKSTNFRAYEEAHIFNMK